MANDDKQSTRKTASAEDPEQIPVSGFQEGVAYPLLPQTPDEFAQLLPNPDKPPQNQSAPSPEQLNPHLYGPQGRL